ncbi:aminopeptidase [Clostridium sp. BL-8]|uniref:aminopeptidase n=1 Tax=Clostridium sp. BL-8 TaxID=349938 RepID=UPI00098C63E7|nr:aminopeptidase [Clostridium sp. BL-8]OOM76767.1 aminopeptidase PepS [Clostridium sp. BL-8]
MTDPRNTKLASNLINYSCELREGEKVLIEANGVETPLIKELIKEAYKANAIPFVSIKDNELERELLMNASKGQLDLRAKYEALRMKDMDAYIGVRASNNSSELSDVPEEKMNLYNRYFKAPVHSDIRVPNTKWCVLRYPNYSMAQSADMSTEAFEEFYFNVCNLDYSKMSKAMDSLVELMNKTDKVRLVAPGTDLTFSIKDIPAIKCDGKANIPDGEVYTAPVKNSINGTLAYNTPSAYNGFTFTDIKFEFKDGKIINATANNSKRLNEILNTDDGARYVGEFAIGVNPYILHPMKDTLFDEKIAGSIHFTPGASYDEAPNGNSSAIHWDLVLIQRADYGGGEIYFDDVLIRKDGIFVIDELKVLNPENLK